MSLRWFPFPSFNCGRATPHTILLVICGELKTRFAHRAEGADAFGFFDGGEGTFVEEQVLHSTASGVFMPVGSAVTECSVSFRPQFDDVD
jgi:predicted Rossmann-fold nucleotide-binding protein